MVGPGVPRQRRLGPRYRIVLKGKDNTQRMPAEGVAVPRNGTRRGNVCDWAVPLLRRGGEPGGTAGCKQGARNNCLAAEEASRPTCQRNGQHSRSNRPSAAAGCPHLNSGRHLRKVGATILGHPTSDMTVSAPASTSTALKRRAGVGRAIGTARDRPIVSGRPPNAALQGGKGTDRVAAPCMLPGRAAAPAPAVGPQGRHLAFILPRTTTITSRGQQILVIRLIGVDLAASGSPSRWEALGLPSGSSACNTLDAGTASPHFNGNLNCYNEARYRCNTSVKGTL